MWQRSGGGTYDPRAQQGRSAAGGPPSRAQREYAASASQRERAAYIAAAKARSAKARGYFDESEEEEEEADDLVREAGGSGGPDAEDEVDPLDAFMAANDSSLRAPAAAAKAKRPRPERLDESARDAAEDAMAEAAARERRAAGAEDDGGDEAAAAAEARGADVRYVDGKAVVDASKKRRIDGLAPVDHRDFTYEAVDHVFLDLQEWNAAGGGDAAAGGGDVARLSDGSSVRPAASFGELFGAAPRASWLLKAVARLGFERPTAVQALAAPAALAGKDVLALAETGSGKTLAYGWPLLAHCAAQRPSEAKVEGPLGLVLCPTRELCEQIFRELSKFARLGPKRGGASSDVVAVFGGSGKYEMGVALAKRGADVAVATPGRLIELITSSATELQSRCAFVVVDEADRMFELGFADQLKGLLQHVRPARQAIFCTATLPRKLDGLVRGALRDPVRVVVGGGDSASTVNDRVAQRAHVLPAAHHKWNWLATNLERLIGATHKAIVFCGTRKAVDALGTSVTSRFGQTAFVAALHGDKDQAQRAHALAKFKAHAGRAILVATDVAARGIDVPDVAAVVNYDVPTSIEQYVHRCGRTGRRSKRDDDDGPQHGEAHTLLVQTSTDDEAFARSLVRSLRSSATSQPDSALLAFAKMRALPPPQGAVGAFVPEEQQRPPPLLGAGPPPHFAPPPTHNPAFAPPQTSAVRHNPAFAPPPQTSAFAPPPRQPPTAAAPNLDLAAAAARAVAAKFGTGFSAAPPPPPATGFSPPATGFSPPPPPPPPPAGGQATGVEAALLAARQIAARLGGQPSRFDQRQ